MGRSLRVLGMALVPFGAFLLDREFSRELRDDETTFAPKTT
jgi:hypothetical protein